MPTIKAMNSEQLNYLISGIGGVNECRDKALLILMANTGLRVGEAVGLNHGDVIRGGGVTDVLFVRAEIAKGKHKREIPLNQKAKVAIQNVLDFNTRRGISTTADAPLFISRNGNRLSKRMVQHMVQSIRGEIDWATPHKLRHTFATNVLHNTGNVRITQQLLGHANLNTTMLYTHPALSDLAGAVNTL
jgi:integrase/recombinase XerC